MKLITAITALITAANAFAAAPAERPAVAQASPAASTAPDEKVDTKTGAKAEANTAAEIKKIDKAAGKVTLKHAAIENLQMPPMTMVFRVKDPSLLEPLKAGDKVKVRVEQIEGNYTVTAIETAQ
jgi:Cu(I)/Ag(I) efflux system periplasmic protein CusF